MFKAFPPRSHQDKILAVKAIRAYDQPVTTGDSFREKEDEPRCYFSSKLRAVRQSLFHTCNAYAACKGGVV